MDANDEDDNISVNIVEEGKLKHDAICRLLFNIINSITTTTTYVKDLEFKFLKMA